jgi:hypothetical protein
MDGEAFRNIAIITEAPGGIPRLRDLVLDLAISGRLTNDFERARWAVDSTGHRELWASRDSPVTGADVLAGFACLCPRT